MVKSWQEGGEEVGGGDEDLEEVEGRAGELKAKERSKRNEVGYGYGNGVT